MTNKYQNLANLVAVYVLRTGKSWVLSPPLLHRHVYIRRCNILKYQTGPLAQPVEQWIFNPLVGRSNRPRPTISLSFKLFISTIVCVRG